MFTFLGPLAAGDEKLRLHSFRVPCGFPSPAADHIECRISLDELLDIRAPHMYPVRREGNSRGSAPVYSAATWWWSIARSKPRRRGSGVVWLSLSIPIGLPHGPVFNAAFRTEPSVALNQACIQATGSKSMKRLSRLWTGVGTASAVVVGAGLGGCGLVDAPVMWAIMLAPQVPFMLYGQWPELAEKRERPVRRHVDTYYGMPLRKVSRQLTGKKKPAFAG
jgi:hypothetical protein